MSTLNSFVPDYHKHIFTLMGTAWIRLTVDHFEEAEKTQCYNHFYQAKPYQLSEHNSKINCKYTKFSKRRKN